MQMSVENALTGLFTGVKNSSVAVQATFLGDLIGGQEKVCGDGRAIASNSGSIFGVQGWN